MNGDGFRVFVKEGDTVRKGDRILTMDLSKIRAGGLSTLVVVIVTNSEDMARVELVASGDVEAGDALMKAE